MKELSNVSTKKQKEVNFMYIIIKSAKTITNGSEKLSASAVVNSGKVFSFTVIHPFGDYEAVAKTGTETQVLRTFRTEDEARRFIGAIVEALEAKQEFFDIEDFLYRESHPDADKWQ